LFIFLPSPLDYPISLGLDLHLNAALNIMLGSTKKTMADATCFSE